MGGIAYKMELSEQLKNALVELRKDKQRKFDQTVDFIINLQKFDLKKNSVNLVISLPNKIKEKKICAFLDSKNTGIETITFAEFKKYSEKKELKKLIKKFDFFISQASLMPKVATTFGRYLGPAGKMPSPQLGIILNADEKTLGEIKEKVNNSIKIKTKESSIKLPIGKQSMSDEAIVENILSVYNAVLKELPRDKENIKNLEVKFTMTKPQKITLK
jgi:large subunit ribosomal protein L1